MNKKLAIITGGGQGIGRAIADIFALNGFDLCLISRNIQTLQIAKKELESTYKNQTLIFAADLSKKNEVNTALEFINNLNKNIDVLVNNTGTYMPGQVHNEAEGNLEKMIETNLYSAYNLTKGIVPSMIAQKSGHIFTICSVASIMPYINGGSYCISKFALLGFTKVLREEMKEFGIKVTAILPGATKTASWDGANIEDSRLMQPQDVAEGIMSAYKMSKNSVVEELLIRPQLGDL